MGFVVERDVTVMSTATAATATSRSSMSLGGVAENKIAYVVALLEDDAVSHERAEGEERKAT